MSEYKNVQKPFLEALEAIGWVVIDQEPDGIPKDPKKSLRDSFTEVLLKGVFKESIKAINLTDNGEPWLTDKQLNDLYEEVTEKEKHAFSLLESNKSVFERLTGVVKTTVDKNEVTGEQNAMVKLIDYDLHEKNSFIAISEFRIDTPGTAKEHIRPDIVLFVNGLPFVVVECKEVDKAEPMSEAIDQIQRYAELRDDEYGVKEGEQRLFHYNLFSIATHGKEARFGTISGTFEYYLNWKDIFPEVYRTIDVDKYSAEEEKIFKLSPLEKEPPVRQNVTIHGLLNKEVLLDVLRHFTLFMEIKQGVEIKLLCRYQQFRAVGKILDRLRNGSTGDERSGVVWHTQGSGKSLTMVFLVRKLRSQEDLKDYKVIMMVDRTDLEKQLSDTVQLTGEFKEKNIVKSRKELRPKLAGDSSQLYMAMIHKFLHEDEIQSKALLRALEEDGVVPEFKPFEVVNETDRVVILIDEAHRSQGGDMGDNFFTAFPNAAKIAFTGTPLLTERHKKKTHEKFGGSSEFIDTYKIRQAVEDRATLDIIYIGKTSSDNIKDEEAFERAFTDEFKHRTEEEKEEIKRRYGNMGMYLESKERIAEIAKDLVNHYVDDILPNGFKAMAVASSVVAAARYEYEIIKALNSRLKEEKEKSEPDEELIEQIEFLKIATVVTQQDNNEEAYITAVRKKAKEINAVDNFKKDFDYSKDEDGNYLKPETGVAFLCVCDRLLTGFDAPIAQVMYLDKNIREHDLLQAIARVNRTKGEKEHGIVVDYYGVSNHLREALEIWDEDEENLKELLSFFRDIDKEIPVLEVRYKRLLDLFHDHGIKNFEAFVTQKITDKDEEFAVAEKCIELAEKIAFRAQFDTYLKNFFDSLDLLFNSRIAKDYYVPAKRFGYLLMRIRNRYKDPTMDLKWAKAKVRKLIDKYLETLDIDSKIPPVSLLSDDFPKEVNKFSVTPKAKASEMEHAIRKHIKVNLDKDPALYKSFLEKMEDVLKRYEDNWEELVAELERLREELKKGRRKTEGGLTNQQSPFFDLIILQAFKKNFDQEEETKEKLKKVTIEIVDKLQDALNKPNFWKEREADIRKLTGELDDILNFSGIEQLENEKDQLKSDIMQLAKRRHQELTGED